MKLNHITRRSVIATLCMLLSSQAMAYKLWTDCGNGTPRKWPSGFTFNANPTGFDGEYSIWRDSFQVAVNRFNATPANLTIGVRVDNDTDVGVQNGESEIWWNDEGQSAVGYNITNPCGNTVEGDIIFHNTVPYDDSMEDKTNFWNYGGGGRTFETTALHEIGHTVGLAHENRYYNIMGSDYTHVHTTGNNALRSYMGEDGTDGLIAIYGGSTRQDLSLAAWRHTGASGEYSSHGRTRLFSSSGSELSSEVAVQDCGYSNCERRYDVDLGQQIQYELTLENNGSNSQNVKLSYYISTNASITTGDTLIGSDNVSVTRNTPDTVRKNVTIPTNLNPNTNYYLGAIIDSDNSVSEWTEANNSSYIHIRTGSGGSSSGGSSSGGSSSGGSSSGGQLENGVPVSGLSASTGNDVVYTINVPSGASNLVIKIEGGSGDADLYTRAGSVPTDSNYECRPYANGNSETCTKPNPSSGTWYARVKAYSSFSNVTLTASYDGGGSSSGGSSSGGSSSGGNELQNGVPVSGLSASTGNDVVYTINVPGGSSNLVIKINGGSGDADLYTRAGAVPTDSNYQCRPYANGNNETCTEPNPSSGTWYARVKAYSSFSNVTLTASYNGGGSSSGGSSSGGSSSGGSSGGGIDNACASESPHSGNGVTAGDTICVPSGSSSTTIRYFWIYVPSNTNSMLIRTQHGSGNGNLYYKASSWANSSNADQSSTNSGNTESITVNNPPSGYRYVSVIGQQSGMSLRIDLQ